MALEQVRLAEALNWVDESLPLGKPAAEFDRIAVDRYRRILKSDLPSATRDEIVIIHCEGKPVRRATLQANDFACQELSNMKEAGCSPATLVTDFPTSSNSYAQFASRNQHAISEEHIRILPNGDGTRWITWLLHTITAISTRDQGIVREPGTG